MSKYIKSLFEKNSKLQIMPVRMNKRKARAALNLLVLVGENLDMIANNPDEKEYEEYQDAITWFRNQILKRYSIAETML